MADNLCGPSNALQNFQKHSTVDRTLQQDRLVSRSASSHGFRSLPGPNAGHLDPEFEAFQSGQPSYGGQVGHPQLSNPSTPFRPSHPSTPQSLNQPGSSGWASDFQRLQISTPTPSPLHMSKLQNQAQQRQDIGGWHNDFAQQFQNGQNSGMTQSGQMGSQAFGNRFSSGGVGMGMGIQQYGGGMMGQTEQIQQPVETFDDAAFARAFEEASRAELEAQEEFAALSREIDTLNDESRQGQTLSQDQNVEMDQEILLDKSAEQLMSSDQPQIPNQAPLGADLIEDHRLQPGKEDPDAMARTAAHVLDTVRNNPSDKFANSEFFGLMRQFRDRELTVAGDQIVESSDGRPNGGEDANVQA